jgi:4-hydroxybenzoate polyprenyltransferase
MFEFSAFMRPKISFTGATVAAFGFLLFNSLDARLLLVFFSSFFAAAFAYSFNSITDVVEDSVNRGVSKYATSRCGLLVSVCFALVGGVIASFLGLQPLLFYFLVIGVSFAYSFFQVKRFFPWKSIYVGFGYSTIFLFGASLVPLTSEVLLYYFLVSMVIFSMGTIADLRDYRGDKESKVPTLPVRLGIEKSKKIVYASLIFLSSLIILFHLFKMLVVIPFAIAATLLLKNDIHPRIAHDYMRAGVLMLPFVTLLSRVFG